MKRVVLIVGPPRSGTSAVSHIVNKLGVSFGDPKRFVDSDKNKHNPIFFELEELNVINDEIFLWFNKTWADFDWLPLASDFNDEVFTCFEGRVKQFLDSELKGGNVIGLKDPRFCFTFPVWYILLGRLGYEVDCVFTVRDPKAIFSSNTIVNKTYSSGRNFRITLESILAASYFLKGKQVVRVVYEELLSQPKCGVKRLCDDLRLEPSLVEDACSVIQQSLSHGSNVSGDACFKYFERVLEPGVDLVIEYERYREVATALTVERDSLIGTMRLTIAEKDSKLAERDSQLAESDRKLAERDGQLAESDRKLAERDAQLSESDGRLTALYNSTSWQMTSPLRTVSHKVKQIRNAIVLIKPAIKLGGGLSTTLKKALRLYRQEGLSGVKLGFRLVAESGQDFTADDSGDLNTTDYVEWGRPSNALTDAPRATVLGWIDELEYKPLISVVIPSYNSNPECFTGVIESIRKQIYPNWELCIASYASDDNIRALLVRYSQEDDRIKIVFNECSQNDLLRNSALELVTGEYGAIIESDIFFDEMALFWVAQKINNSPEFKVICSNEDEIDLSNEGLAPLIDFFDLKDIYKQVGNDKMINRINKVFCYWRDNGTKALGRAVFLKLASNNVQQDCSGEHKLAIEQVGAGNVLNLLNARFDSSTPLRTYSLPSLSQTCRVNIVTDSIGSSSLFGGVGTALIFAALLANKLGAQLRVITRTECAEPSSLYSMLSLYGITLENEVQFEFAAFYDYKYELDVFNNDLFITTSWWTTAATLSSVPHESIVYLLQEDERMFYPFGDDRYKCEEVLRNSNIRFLINTKLLFDHLVDSGLSNIFSHGAWFEPAFPEQVYRPRPKDGNGKRKLFFYARPNNPRNLFYLGVEVIENAVAQGVLNLDEWDICFVGKDFPEITFNGGHKPIRYENLTWSEYAQLIGSVDVGLSLMYTPHPSYPPLDLVSSGAVVVTNRFANKLDLSNYSPNLICADLNPDALVKALDKAIHITADARVREQNYFNNGLLTNWNEAFAETIMDLVEQVECSQ